MGDLENLLKKPIEEKERKNYKEAKVGWETWKIYFFEKVSSFEAREAHRY